MLRPTFSWLSGGPSVVLLTIVLLALLQALPSSWHQLLRYERHAVLDGELWRLWTGHLIHLGWAHWGLNTMGLLLCGLLTDHWPHARVLLMRVLSLSLFISAGFVLLMPSLSQYVGLSGVLYGLYVLALWPGVSRRDPLAVIALLLVLAWLAWQWLVGPAQQEVALIGGDIIFQAHGYGIAGALLMVLVQRRRVRL
jgi:rhomboid family GlyGly-CTERM serine protease